MTENEKLLKTCKVTDAYQIIVPKEVREQLNIKGGDHIRVEFIGKVKITEHLIS